MNRSALNLKCLDIHSDENRINVTFTKHKELLYIIFHILRKNPSKKEKRVLPVSVLRIRYNSKNYLVLNFFKYKFR